MELFEKHKTIVGRTRKDLKRFGEIAIGYIGKHIVGTGEDAHLTTKVYIDLLKVHVILVCGKRGSGKSYANGVMLEEFSSLKDEYRKKMAFVVVDPVGIYWSMKFPNEQQKNLLKQWKLEPKKTENVRVFVPLKQKEEYLSAGVPVDGTIALTLKDISVEELILGFGFRRTEEIAVLLEKSFTNLLESGKNFDFSDLVKEVEGDKETKKEVRDALISLLRVADKWGLIVKKGINMKDLVKPGMITIVDVSRMRSDELRNLLVALIAKEIYRLRVLSRKEEEKARIVGEEIKFKFPLTWLVLEEAHNFIPSDKEVASSAAIKTIARQGREPGIGLVCITQMPNKIHQDVLSQTDLVVSFRLTSRDDLRALHSVMQTYMQEELEKYINDLPRWHGTAIILDDNLERVFTVTIRPRLSWHAGGTAAIL